MPDELALFLARLDTIVSQALRRRSGGIDDLRRLGHGKIVVTLTLYDGKVTLADMSIGSMDIPERKK